MLESSTLDRNYSEKLVQLLDNFPIIGDIIKQNPADLMQIFHSCIFFKYLPREEIIGRGRYTPWFFYLLKGDCLVMDTDRNVTVELIRPGQLFGELDVVMDATGQNTVLADPTGQEVILMGMNSSIFTAQSSIRLLDNATRISCFQALFRSLQAKHGLMRQILNNTSGHVEDSEFELTALDEPQDGTEQLVFFDIETKKLAIKTNQLRTRIFETIKNHAQGLLEINTYITNENFNKQDISSFIRELLFNPEPVVAEQDCIKQGDISSELEKSKYYSIYEIKELSFLVVDDDDQYRDSAVNSLKELGAEKIYIKNDGRAAWNFVCENPTRIDVILCDWIMPQMTGLDLYQNLQNGGESMRNIVFIMLTSIESRTSVLEAVESGVHGYAVKPLSKKHLLKQIQQALKHVRGALLKTKE